MTSSPITSRQIDGETIETVRDFIFLSSKIIADGECNHEIKRCLLLGRKSMTKLDSILKSRVITLLTKVCLVKAMVFPAVIYGCESWTIKKADHWRADAFELWGWRLFRVPWPAKRSSQSILKEIYPEYSLEGLMLKLKLQYFGDLLRRTDSFEKTLILGKIEGGRRKGCQRMRWLDGMTDSKDMGLSRFWVLVMDREACWAAVHVVAKGQTCLSKWTDWNFSRFYLLIINFNLSVMPSPLPCWQCTHPNIINKPTLESLLESESEVAQSDSLWPVDCSPPSSSVHGILQARILERLAISFSRGSSRPRDRTQVSHTAPRRFNLCTTREALLFINY